MLHEYVGCFKNFNCVAHSCFINSMQQWGKLYIPKKATEMQKILFNEVYVARIKKMLHVNEARYTKKATRIQKNYVYN